MARVLFHSIARTRQTYHNVDSVIWVEVVSSRRDSNQFIYFVIRYQWICLNNEKQNVRFPHNLCCWVRCTIWCVHNFDWLHFFWKSLHSSARILFHKHGLRCFGMCKRNLKYTIFYWFTLHHNISSYILFKTRLFIFPICYICSVYCCLRTLNAYTRDSHLRTL